MIYKEEDIKPKIKRNYERISRKIEAKNKRGNFKEKVLKVTKEYSILAFSLVLVVAGYISYLSKYEKTKVTNTDVNKVAEIGDATLVNSNDIEANDSSVLEDEESPKTDVALVENEEAENTNNNEATKQTVSTSSNEYFISSRMERENMYSQSVESYQKIIENPNCSAMERNDANERINEINEIKNSIMIAENLIKTKGFEECVIFVNTGSVNIVVKKEDLTQEDIAKIQNIVARELSQEVENIHISNKY